MSYRSRLRTSRAFALSAFLFTPGVLGCTSTSADQASRAVSPSSPAAAAPVSAAAPASPEVAQGAPSEPVRAQPAEPAKQRVVYDLGAHVEHADLFRGDTLVLDFGEPGGAKYTLGGWGTRVIPGADIDGATTAFVRGSYGDVLLPVQHDGALVIEVRLRAPRDGEVTLYLDEQVALRTKIARDAFGTVKLELPAGKLARGEHMLRVRGSGLGRIGKHETAIALDWVAIGPKELGEYTPPQAKELAPEPHKLVIPEGHALGYGVAVEQGMRLVGELTTGKLYVRAVDDAFATKTLAELSAGQKLDVDLAPFAGKVVRLDLVATSDAALKSPLIVVPDTREPAAEKAEKKRVNNVLIYLIDTLRADHLKPFNDKTRVRTPGLDGLVAQGAAVFTSAHTQENWTKPSVATLLSSLFPWEHHAVTTEAVVPKDVDMLPEILEREGFYSGAFIANGYVSDKFGFKQGWDTWRNYIREGRPTRAKFLAADAVEWLDKRPEKLPFFLYVHAIDPHVPYKPTREFMEIYDPEPYSGVVDFSKDNALLEKIKIGSIRLNERDKRRLVALYDSEISYHDLHFRTILQALEKRGLFEDTLIFIVADHGEEFWDHGSVGHGHSVYEELLRIPMVVHLPGVTTKPTYIKSASGLVDVVPTVLEALGIAAPEGLSGRSLMPELLGSHLSAPPVAVSGFMDGWRTVVIGHHKLIQRTERRVMLHDLASDPHEQVDVVAERPITTRYLRGQLGLVLAQSEPIGQGAAGKKTHKKETTTIDAETEAQLRALGYVGTSRR